MNAVREKLTVQERCRLLAEAMRPPLTRLNIVLRRDASHLLVTPSQATALAVLGDGSRRMSDLTQYVGVRGPSMTVLVDRMERQGWVRRIADPDDRRSVRVEITPKGCEAIAQVQAA